MARKRPRATRHGQKTAKETLNLTRNWHKAIPRLTKDVQLIPDITKSSLYLYRMEHSKESVEKDDLYKTRHAENVKR